MANVSSALSYYPTVVVISIIIHIIILERLYYLL